MGFGGFLGHSVRMGEEEKHVSTDDDGKAPESNKIRAERLKKKRKERLLKEAVNADKRGVCYLSRIPPRMDPLKLRQILSQFGEIERIYLTPQDSNARVHRKRGGGFRGQEFSGGYEKFTEGWVEFTKKSVAKRVASMLNGEQVGGKRRSSFYYDLWNIKYLSKFKWDHLTEEIAYKNAAREQKLALEISAAKRERDHVLSKYEKSRSLSSARIAIEERMKKKQKVSQESGVPVELLSNQQAPTVKRQFAQIRPVTDKVGENKPTLSHDILAEIFRSGS